MLDSSKKGARVQALVPWVLFTGFLLLFGRIVPTFFR